MGGIPVGNVNELDHIDSNTIQSDRVTLVGAQILPLVDVTGLRNP